MGPAYVMATSGVAEHWELAPPANPDWAIHGQGCSGSAALPHLDRVGTALPSLGSAFPLQLSSLPQAPGAAWLAFGFGIDNWNGAALPLRLAGIGLPACDLWIAPELAL